MLPPLKPNQPNHNISVPSTASGKLDPVNFPLFASEYLPILGPKIKIPDKAIQPPTEWTIVLPAKSTNHNAASHPLFIASPR